MIVKENIDGGKAFDWGKASGDYAKYRDIYPRELYDRIIRLGLCVEGQDVLDLGTGTGVLARNLYRYGARFTGADSSQRQIAQARRLSEEKGMDIAYIVSSAEDIAFPTGSFDVVTACQCHIYFDKRIALPKIHHVLRSDGHFCIVWMAWLPDEDAVAGASEELVLQYNPFWTGAGYKRGAMVSPTWAAPLFRAAFIDAFDVALPFSRQSWHGRMKACRGIGASSLSPEQVLDFEREHIQMLSRFPAEFRVLHHVTIADFVKIQEPQ